MRRKRSIGHIWQDSFMRELYFGGVLFTELLQDCYESNVPLFPSGPWGR